MEHATKTPLDYRCMVCNALPGSPCVTLDGEAKNGTHIARECEAALDMDLEDGERVLARHGFKHDGSGRDADTQAFASDFIKAIGEVEMSAPATPTPTP